MPVAGSAYNFIIIHLSKMELYPLYEFNPSLREVRNVCYRLGKGEKYVFFVLEELRKYNLGFGKLAVLAYFYTVEKEKQKVLCVAREINISLKELRRAEREIKRRMCVYAALHSEKVVCPYCLSDHVVSKKYRKLCKSCGKTFSWSPNKKLAWKIFITKAGTLRTKEKSTEEVAKELKVSKKTVVKYLKIIKKLYLLNKPVYEGEQSGPDY
jgi:transposase-like protein